MSLSVRRLPEYGPEPWQQRSWDWRAAGNFIGGGAGTGLIVFAALSGASGTALAALMLAGLALVGLGLVLRFAGARPAAARAQRLPQSAGRRGWGARRGRRRCSSPPGSRPRGACRDWRGSPRRSRSSSSIARRACCRRPRAFPPGASRCSCRCSLTTGLAEGGGLFFASAPWHRIGTLWLLAGLRRARAGPRPRLARVSPPPGGRGRARGRRRARSRGARAAARGNAGAARARRGDRAGRVSGAATAWVAALAGLAAALAGAYAKLMLITGAGFNQGFTLAHLPVRGVRAK